MQRDYKDWVKIEGYNYYYVGSWADDGDFVSKNRVVNVGKKLYDRITESKFDKNIITIKIEKGREIKCQAFLAGVFECDCKNV